MGKRPSEIEPGNHYYDSKGRERAKQPFVKLIPSIVDHEVWQREDTLRLFIYFLTQLHFCGRLLPYGWVITNTSNIKKILSTKQPDGSRSKVLSKQAFRTIDRLISLGCIKVYASSGVFVEQSPLAALKIEALSPKKWVPGESRGLLRGTGTILLDGYEQWPYFGDRGRVTHLLVRVVNAGNYNETMAEKVRSKFRIRFTEQYLAQERQSPYQELGLTSHESGVLYPRGRARSYGAPARAMRATRAGAMISKIAPTEGKGEPLDPSRARARPAAAPPLIRQSEDPGSQPTDPKPRTPGGPEPGCESSRAAASSDVGLRESENGATLSGPGDGDGAEPGNGDLAMVAAELARVLDRASKSVEGFSRFAGLDAGDWSDPALRYVRELEASGEHVDAGLEGDLVVSWFATRRRKPGYTMPGGLLQGFLKDRHRWRKAREQDVVVSAEKEPVEATGESKAPKEGKPVLHGHNKLVRHAGLTDSDMDAFMFLDWADADPIGKRVNTFLLHDGLTPSIDSSAKLLGISENGEVVWVFRFPWECDNESVPASLMEEVEAFEKRQGSERESDGGSNVGQS